MKRKHIRFLIILVGILAISLNTFQLFSKNYADEEKFISMAILNSQNKIDNYFDPDSTSVKLNSKIYWNILIKNIGKINYATIIIKLINDKNKLPDQLYCIPSNSSTIYEIRKILSNNDNITIPFNWEIYVSDSNYINIDINDHNIKTDLLYETDEELTLVFELWLFNVEENDFVFKWESRTEDQCIWTGISFSIE